MTCATNCDPLRERNPRHGAPGRQRLLVARRDIAQSHLRCFDQGCGSPGILPPASQARRSRDSCGSPTTQCLEMGTINGAKAMGIANKTGSLESGKRADIILLRASDINMLPFHDGHSAVLHSQTHEQRRHRDRGWQSAQIRRQDSQRQYRRRAPRGNANRSIFCASVPAASGRRSLGKNARPRITADSSASSVVASIVPVARANSLSM